MGNQTFSKRIRRGSIICPVCAHDAGIHGTDRVTPRSTTLWCHCTNTDCGLTWRAVVEFVHVCSPSGIDHDLDLPGPPDGYQRTVAPPPLEDPDQLKMFAEDGEPPPEDADAARPPEDRRAA